MHVNRRKKAVYIKYILCMFLLVFSFSFLLPHPAFAAECGGVNTSLVECNSTEGGGAIREILVIIVNALSIGIGILAVIGIAITGTQYLTAGGNEQQVTKAKTRLREIIIGVAVYVVMWGILNWLLPGGFSMGTVEVSSVTLPQTATFYAGKTAKLTPSIAPLDANDQTLTWTSSNPEVASVNDKGVITTKNVGMTTITATANGKSGSTVVTVKPEPVEIDERAAYKQSSGSGSGYKGKGLSKEQAQKLADYYNSDEVNIADYTNGATNSKEDCSAFASWFLVAFTDLKNNHIQDGIDTFYVHTAKVNFGDNIAGVPQQSTNPGAFAIVSTNVNGGIAYNGSFTHVGVIVGYEGNTSTTVEAAYGTPGWNAHVWQYSSLPNGLAYNDINGHIKKEELEAIVGDF